jgi:hypothetical protein
LEPGEKQQLYYSILMDNNVKLKSLDVLTPESFVGADQRTTSYNVRLLNVKLPAGTLGFQGINLLFSYQMGMPIQFDSANKLINPDVEVSLSELRLHKAEGDGFNIAIAKLKLVNRGKSPVPVPVFAAQLMDEKGNQFSGNRQSASADTLAPDLSYVISYSFNLPSVYASEKLAMMIFDNQTIAPFYVPIAAIPTQIQAETDGSSVSIYPFQVNFVGWTFSSNQLKLNTEVYRDDNIIVDQNYSGLIFELLDDEGTVIGSESKPLIGEKRLINGWQTLTAGNMDSELLKIPKTIRVYEAIDTPFGVAKRLLKTLRH